MTVTAASANRVLVVDSSALLCRYLPDRRRGLVNQTLMGAADVVVTGLTRSEVTAAVRLALGDGHDDAVLSLIADDWDRFWIAPVDDRSVRRAADLMVVYGLNMVSALHLAAVEILGSLDRPVALLTFDDRQVVAAAELGFDPVDDTGAWSTAHDLLDTGPRSAGQSDGAMASPGSGPSG